MKSFTHGLLAISATGLGLVWSAPAPDFATLEKEYDTTILPLLSRYCLDCHDEASNEGELDLERFTGLAEVRKSIKTWQHVVAQLENGEMPPKKKNRKPPSEAERAVLIGWAKRYLDTEALAQAGDPGPVLLRRLSNSEYTYTVRDLTGVSSLDPAREFPVDSAAGEGFTNTGEALVMSPSLVEKYLAAAKEIAAHAVLLPDGIGFSAFTTQRDKTNELMARIQKIYRNYTIQGKGAPVNLQGIKFNTNQGGLLPIERYLAATLGGSRDGLSPKYLALLEDSLAGNDGPGAPVLDPLRARWRKTSVNEVATLTAEVGTWQKALWKFSSIGHIGRAGGPTRWLEPVTPIQSSQEFSMALTDPGNGKDLTIYLAAGTAGDGDDGDHVLWKKPRLRMAGQPNIPLRDVASLQQRLDNYRSEILSRTEAYLSAAAVVADHPDHSLKELANEHQLDLQVLQAWLSFLKLGKVGPVVVNGHYTEKMVKSGNNHEFIQGWGTHETPSIGANSSDQEVRIPGIARPHGVICHPSPTLFTAVGWQSPVNGEFEIRARLSDAHPECGNGVEWYLQHRTSSGVSTFWSGDFPAGGSAGMPARTIWVNQGELISCIVGPREGSHACDLTAIDLTLAETTGKKRIWDLAGDVSGNILAANPHADLHGNQGVWHFYKGEMESLDRKPGAGSGVPKGSLLAKWIEATGPRMRKKLAGEVQALASGQAKAEAGSPDEAMLAQLRSLASARNLLPLLDNLEPDPRFGVHPADDGAKIDPLDLIATSPAMMKFRIPATLARGREFVVTGTLAGRSGSVQLGVSTGASPAVGSNLSPASPVLAAEGSEARARLVAAFDAFRALLPLTLCYERIVPVDEVVTLVLWHREDDHLQRLMLDEAETTALDRLWDQLYFVAREPREYLVAFNQICEFATQDRPDLVVAWKPHRAPTEERAAKFQQLLLDTEPVHLEAILELARRAWRRPLTGTERESLRTLYRNLRAGKIDHDPAIRLTLTRVFTSPAFLYKAEEPAAGDRPGTVSNWELATRLSYFLTSSAPDSALREASAAGSLTNPQTLQTHARRLLRDERARRLATEFACQWLHVRDFDQHDEKNEKLYPEFAELRGSIYEESIRFFTDFFRNDRSILSLLDADHTFADAELAKFYDLPAPEKDWQRIDGLRQHGRGGLLGFATTLAKQSGASRTSPILRGNWISEILLGEKLPKPPKDVPTLPDQVPVGLSVRALIQQHSSDPACAKCHDRIDPYGFALESFDTIGRFRKGRDTSATLPDGTAIRGLDGLRSYLLEKRGNTFVRHFCQKLLGYALGRAVQLSDKPLLDEIMESLPHNDYRIGIVVEAIVLSPQFRQIRGIDHP